MSDSLATSSAANRSQTAFQEGQQYYQSFLDQDGHLAESFANFPRDFWKSLLPEKSVFSMHGGNFA